MQYRLYGRGIVMFEHDEVILEAKHVTRRFPASDGRTLVANDDINLKFYKGKTLGTGRRIRLRKIYFYAIPGVSGYSF